jgi:predicted flap endonuclease-1-like 5' DNA nuclease
VYRVSLLSLKPLILVIEMDSNTLLVLVIVGGLVLFFLYAFYYVSKQNPQKKEKKPTVVKVKDYEPTYTRTALQEEVTETKEKTQPVTYTRLSGDHREATDPGVIEEDKPTITPTAPQQENVSENEEKDPDVEAVSSLDTPVLDVVEDRLNGIDVIDVEGIGPEYKTRLNNIGINTVWDLLSEGATPGGRKIIAEETGITGTLILEWVNICDLFRIGGVGEEYSDLIEEAGVDTVPELARRNPENLHLKLSEVNAEKNLVRRLPSLSDVERWVETAKTLPRKIEY